MPSRADIILANRAYLDHHSPPGGVPAVAANGGLLAAVRPIVAPWENGEGTTWIGAGRGEYDRDFCDGNGIEFIETGRGPLRHQRIFVDNETWDAHYKRVSNSFLWPLLHLVRAPLPDLCDYYPEPLVPTEADWSAHQRVNEAFARAAAAQPLRGTCWVHDYQVALVPRLLRDMEFDGRIGFFLHTPFPSIEVASSFLDEGARVRFAEFVRGILGAHLAGFQGEGDLERFREAAAVLCGAEPTPHGVRIDGREVRLDVYPVGIDPDEIVEAARKGTIPPEVEKAVRPGLPLVVGLERADFTKGIPERLQAIRGAFERGYAFSYVGVSAPTREGVEVYAGLDEAISRASAEAEYAAVQAGGTFLQLNASIPWESVVALQRDADVVFTSSLADGMNLVPLQAAIAQGLRPADQRGTILAGRDAGVSFAFADYREDGLVPVDPLDAQSMTDTLCRALSGGLPRVSDRLIDAVRTNSAHRWATRFLADLEDVQC